MTSSGLVLVHHDAPTDLTFSQWLHGEYLPAIMPLMGLSRVTRNEAISPESASHQFVTILETPDVEHTLAAMNNPAWQQLAAEAVRRGVSRREIAPYRQIFQLEA